jgi:opacity protein-like surface antigen
MTPLFSLANAENSHKFYLKTYIAPTKISTLKSNTNKLASTFTIDSTISPMLGGGVGYYISDTIRTDITVDYLLNTTLSNITSKNRDVAAIAVRSNTVEHSLSVYLTMLNVYVDVLHKENYAFFVGASIGNAHIREKMDVVNNDIVMSLKEGLNFPFDKETYKKTSNRIAYSLTTGFSIMVHPDINLEFAYKWTDLGKSKINARDKDGKRLTNNRYYNNNIQIGLRFDI